MSPTILTFDVGTTAVKVSQYTAAMQPLACISVEYALDSSGVCVTVPVQRYIDAICKGAAALPQRESVAAIGITTQGETLIPVSRDGTPLCDALVWLDARAAEQAAVLRSKLNAEEFYETTGLPDIGEALPLAKLQWLREKTPEIYSSTHKFLLLEDYLLFWLTGRFITEKALLTSTGWFDIRRDCYWEKALHAAGVSSALLPEMLECGTPCGTVLPAAAAMLGIPQTAAVVTGAMDQTAAALAAGCTQPGTVTETTGTALVMAACTDAPVFSTGHRVTVYRHAMAGQYLYLPIGNTAGMALKWFANEFCKDIPPAKVYAVLDKEVQRTPTGCEGLSFLPYLSGCVDPEFLPGATGCFFGVRLSSTRAHFARAVMEAVAYQIADFLDMLAAKGCRARSITSLGGGARSSVWMQMKADICEQPFTVPACTEAASTGAAILAAWGSKLTPYGTMPAQSTATVYTPQAENLPAYRAQRKAVGRLYQAVKPLYEQEME